MASSRLSACRGDKHTTRLALTNAASSGLETAMHLRNQRRNRFKFGSDGQERSPTNAILEPSSQIPKRTTRSALTDAVSPGLETVMRVRIRKRNNFKFRSGEQERSRLPDTDNTPPLSNKATLEPPSHIPTSTDQNFKTPYTLLPLSFLQNSKSLPRSQQVLPKILSYSSFKNTSPPSYTATRVQRSLPGSTPCRA
jgi:hypothetical protein